MNDSLVEFSDGDGMGYHLLKGPPGGADRAKVTEAAEIFIFAVVPVGLLTNAGFLCAVLGRRSARTPFNLFLANLSASGVIYLALALAFAALGELGEGLVRGFCFLFAAAYVASGLFVSLVAAERFLAVCAPLRYSLLARDAWRAARVCAAAWLAALSAGGLVKLVVHFSDYRARALLAVMVFLGTLFVAANAVLYALAIRRLWARPLASTAVQRRVVLRLAATACLVVGFDTTHVAYLLSRYALGDGTAKTPLEMVILALNVASLTVNPLIYGRLNVDLPGLSLRGADGRLRCCCCGGGGGVVVGLDPEDGQPPYVYTRRAVDADAEVEADGAGTPAQTPDL